MGLIKKIAEIEKKRGFLFYGFFTSISVIALFIVLSKIVSELQPFSKNQYTKILTQTGFGMYYGLALSLQYYAYGFITPLLSAINSVGQKTLFLTRNIVIYIVRSRNGYIFFRIHILADSYYLNLLIFYFGLYFLASSFTFHGKHLRFCTQICVWLGMLIYF